MDVVEDFERALDELEDAITGLEEFRNTPVSKETYQRIAVMALKFQSLLRDFDSQRDVTA